MTAHRSVRLWTLLLLLTTCHAFVTPNPSQASFTKLAATEKPVLVVGASGRVGRHVASQLLEKDCPVRALIRNTTKAQEVFGDDINKIELIEADLGHYDDKDCADTLDKAVEGCDAVISVSGTMRFSKWTDFLPWRLLKTDVSSWADRSHPYYTNYMAQKLLVDLSEKHGIQRFVRLTGLTVGLSPFSPISALFCGLFSMSSRYHFLFEQYLRNSSVPSVILRPGGLAENERNTTTTSLQVDASGTLPPPARVGRSDVAALSVAACNLPSDKSYTLAVRWAGDVAPKPQGAKEDGCDDAVECLQGVAKSESEFEAPSGVKPYGAAVALYFYSFAALSFKFASLVLRFIAKAIRK